MRALTQAGDALQALMAQRILVKDGPYGTAIQKLGLDDEVWRRVPGLDRPQKGNNDLLNLAAPEAIAGIARSYAQAGADLLATNSFNANRVSQADYGCGHLVAEIARAAARIVRRVADEAEAEDGRRRFVAGALGPTSKTLSLSPRVEDPGYREIAFEELVGVYRESVDALVDGGVDVLLVETVFDTLNAKAALAAIDDAGAARGVRLPVLVSLTLTDMAGRNLSGQTPHAFWLSVMHARPLAVGLNCSFGATELDPHVRELAGAAEVPLIVYPNAGLPNAMGGYDEPPHETARLVRRWAEAGYVNIVGGCCGTGAAHIAAIAEAVSGLPPRRPPSPPAALRLAGLEPHLFS